jgi:hypothetical protein
MIRGKSVASRNATSATAIPFFIAFWESRKKKMLK